MESRDRNHKDILDVFVKQDTKIIDVLVKKLIFYAIQIGTV
jgi:hypothetical protein